MPPTKHTAKKALATRRPTKPVGKLPPLQSLNFQENSLGYTLRRAQVRAYELFFATLGELDLSPARLTAMSLIATEAPINQAELARKLNVAGPSVVKLIDALEASGLILRAQVEGDRRSYALELTPAGVAMMTTLRQRLASYESKLAGDLSPKERAQLLSLLERVAPV